MASRVDKNQVPPTNDQHLISDATAAARPIFDLRCGGVRVTVERIPYGLLALISTASAFAVGTGNWFIR
ncbi:hypothetical protein [Streptomyces lasiicapitis]|uniref:hypothetical protein n=1 Tax=Streptomyces lasiicapitis TaxID=1923961 RepID=UPI00365FB539